MRRISSTAFFITVRLRRPRKSILSRPIFSTQSMSYCVLTPPSPNLHERRVIDQRAGRDHDARGVRAGVARQPFDRFGRVEQLADLRLRRVERLELGNLLERLVDRQPAGPDGNQLRDAVDVGQRHAQRAAGVANRRARRHRAERDDLRDAVLAVLFA